MSSDRTQAFEGLTDAYHRFRPGYPEGLLDRLREHVRAGADASWPDPWLLVDAGAGTGISTRTLRHAFGPGPRVVGVEPGRDMLAAARAGEHGGVEYVAGRAERLPFPDSSACLVLAAQAVHWFDRPAFYAEAARVLVPGGTVAVLNNDRDHRASAYLDAYERLMEDHGDHYRRDHREYDTVAEMSAQPGLSEAGVSTAGWVRELDTGQVLGMAMSSSKMAAVVRNLGEERTRAHLTALVREHFPDGGVRIPYVTRLFTARRTG
ncbi:methyltransferase domain-containing protein [Nocardiopsis sp. HNM0947]|uniref:Methyltransferase domain-containing protein n=1 Tax=Nocardiopsis coralli TaxID=2772213 RepID=A0ABR9PAM1_9ACTN|nr:methyltransferase domain-containing protein [Nocardiopsis coralli]MBE3000872.1 methyltransferase domain-containing protein [Nocardiopsis coralli]